MQATLLPIIAALFAEQTLATISEGVAHYTDGHTDQAVWLEGDNACDYVYMGPASDNLCAWKDTWFTAQNGFKYRFTGCGRSNFCILNSDSSLNSCSHAAGKSHAGDGCHGKAGSLYIDREWEFY